MFATPRFPMEAAISSSVAKANVLFRMTPLEMLSFSWTYILQLEL